MQKENVDSVKEKTQPKTGTFRPFNEYFEEVFSQIARAISCLPSGFWAACMTFVILNYILFNVSHDDM